MPNAYTSSYDGQQITVDDALKNPLWIPERTMEMLDGAFVEDYLFRNGGTTQSGTFGYTISNAPFVNDEPERVAEGGEIPLTDFNRGEKRLKSTKKDALGIGITWEMRNRSNFDVLSKAQNDLMNTMIRRGVEDTLEAFDEAGVPSMSASAAWAAAGDPVKDVLDAVDQIQGASVVKEGKTAYFNYNPDTILLHPRTLTALLRNEQVQKYYTGSNAEQNPIYKGIRNVELFGLKVAESRYMKPGEVFILQSGVAGFIVTEMPLQMTPFRGVHGDNEIGGDNMTWRSDAVRIRGIAVDNPLAVTKITGA